MNSLAALFLSRPANRGETMDEPMNVERVFSPAHSFPTVGYDRDRGKGRRKRKKEAQAKEQFKRLARAAEEKHEILIKDGSPYRFCVYREGEAVFIDVVLLDENGAIKEVRTKEITHDAYLKWLLYMEAGQGLFIDEPG